MLRWIIKFLKNQDGNLKKMFSWPKSNDPWKAMTKGSTGGWAKSFAKPATLLPAAAAAAAAPFTGGSSLMLLPTIGATVGGIQGATTGLWGKPGMASAGRGLLAGGGQGYGVHGMSQFASSGGFQNAADAIKSWGQPSGITGGAGGQLLQGGKYGTTWSPYGTGAPGAPSGAPSILSGGTGGQGGVASMFNLKNLSNRVLGGSALLGASALLKPPSVSTSPGKALEAVNMPNLTEARSMVRDLAMMNPSELVGPASDKFIEASVRQSRKAHEYQRQQAINDFASQGKTVGKSGAVNERLSRMDAEQVQRETDFITSTNEARYIAGVNQKVQNVANYFNVSQQEAADVLAAYGYISPDDLLKYQSALASYQGMQQLMGTAGGQLLAPQYRQ